MSSTVRNAPEFTEDSAVRLARDLYGLSVTARPLPSERDQNFHLISDDGQAYVLKIANADEHLEVLDLQNQAMMHVTRLEDKPETCQTFCPEVLSSLEGNLTTSVDGQDGVSHFVRLLTWLPGKPLALVKPHDADLLVSLGRFYGRLDRLLQNFDHPAAHRDFHWDLKQAGRVVSELLRFIAEPDDRAIVDRFLTRFRSDIEPLLSGLPQSVIHNDGNDYNVLVGPTGDWGNQVSGVIDFGDMVHACRVNEVAVACAYAMLDKADPLTAAQHIAAGYHETNPLTEKELAVLFDLICMRLCMSVCHSAHQYRLKPDNEYLRISEKPAWTLLKKLADLHPNFGHYAFRSACGLAPVPGSEKIVAWLKRQSGQFASVVETDLRSEKQLVLDLSVGSLEFGSDDDSTDTPVLAERIFSRMREAGADVGIGLYKEARFFYTTEEFEIRTDEMPERRTIHLGVDLFMPGGTPTHAPLDGRVHSFKNNAAHLDYGPAIILEHATDKGDVFYTLYGHLSTDSLDGLKVGQAVAKGAPFARIGERETNGGWTPHLHFQIVTDLLGEVGTFPGVARPSQVDIWTGLCPDPGLILGTPLSSSALSGRSGEELLTIRREKLGRNLSISYNRPLKIVRGRGQYLYSDDGQRYLDGVNNVCHVGHCHPAVNAAGRRQMAVLNTNTRYLHDNIIEYAQRLLSKFPDPLNVCFFVCTGSEANELALRLARTFTNQKDLITVDGAYHGNTQGLIDISPYKHDGPGGRGAPPWVHTVMMPDGYRGPHKGLDASVGAQYARYVLEAVERIRAEDRGPAAFLCESMLGCGGQVVLPDNYMNEAFKHVREAGGLCIADEVQVGFGRAGSHFWAFETQRVVPDIVTLGKPIGNGHPLAAVITTPEIAEVFANGMEYFNTFGGNPVSCAIGMAVLEVIEKENLQENARAVGAHLLNGLRGLAPKYPLIGDVRGQGLFVGVELVLDRQTLEPAAAQADYIINRMKDYGILMSTDGPLHNVLKLKPPIVFSEKNADDLVRALDLVFSEDRLQIQD